MAIATYRGVKYDTEKHKSSFLMWWNRIHCDATRWFSYRGLRYRAFDSCQKDLKASMEERPSGLWQLLGKRFPSVCLKLSTSEGKTLYTRVEVLLCKVLFPKIPS